MSFAPQFQPTGGFGFDPSRSGQPLHANVFRPPPSPSTSSYNLAKSTGSLFSDISMSAAQSTGTAKRKRTGTRESTPLGWNTNMEEADVRDEGRSREFRYTLAGQISTPAGPPAGVENGLLEDSVYSDVDYRRALGPKSDLTADFPSGRERSPTNTPGLTGWSLFSLQTIGDVVGKVWEFCKNGAFRGFHAGGGQGYNVNGATVTQTTGTPLPPSPETRCPFADATPVDPELPAYFPPVSPAYFPPTSPAYFTPISPDSTPRPAAKRRQVSANNDELKNWVVVDEPGNPQPKRFAAEVKAAAARPNGSPKPRPGYYSQTAASAHRRIAAPSQRFAGGTPNFSRAAARPSLRVSHVGSPNLTAREPASFASPRSSPATPQMSRIPVPIQPSPQISHNPNPFALPVPAASSTSGRTSTASRPSSRQSHTHTRSSLSLGLSSTRPTSPTKFANHHQHHRRNQSSSSVPSNRRQSALQLTTTTTTPTTPTAAAAAMTTRQGTLQSTTSPRLDAEARQLAQRKLAAERDADAKVDAFNARLLSMIRQGREALGTRVEVEMTDG
ncbi:hypothetical protein N658DRAFT_452860, partial [Parathielavia hyrcaniae]